jgi:hypothetical protein
MHAQLSGHEVAPDNVPETCVHVVLVSMLIACSSRHLRRA